MNEGFGKDFHRKGNAVKRSPSRKSAPISELCPKLYEIISFLLMKLVKVIVNVRGCKLQSQPM